MIIGVCGHQARAKEILLDKLKERGYKYLDINKTISDMAAMADTAKTLLGMRDFEWDSRKRHGNDFFLKRTLQDSEDQDLIIDNIRTEEEVELLNGKPKFCLIGVYNPRHIKLERDLTRRRIEELKNMDLHEHLEDSDLMSKVHFLKVLNCTHYNLHTALHEEEVEGAVNETIKDMEKKFGVVKKSY
ncbi:hypothetical protein JW868_04745 [Candidatus Woesearchaeota archaeon]|nr:hypothetical protein [Candidatus Woesearchaeota archaeon]